MSSGRTIGRLITFRCLMLIPVAVGVSALVFAAGRIASPSPSTTALSVYATPSAREEFIRERHLDEPLVAQYGLWMSDLVQGNLGRSYITGAPVSDAIRAAFPVTLQLALGAFVLTAVFGLALGTVGGLRRGGIVDRAIVALGVLGVSLPAFWVGILLIEFLAVYAGLLPAGGYVPFTRDPQSWFQSMLLPWITLALAPTCVIARVTRARLCDEMARPHVKTALALGVSRRRTVAAYVVRNSLVEPTAMLGVMLGYMLGGVVTTEKVFSLPGLGNQALLAVNQSDFPLLQAIALLVITIFMVTSLLVDILHVTIDRGVARGA